MMLRQIHPGSGKAVREYFFGGQDYGGRIHTVDEHACVTMTGFVSDGIHVVNRAREKVSSYEETRVFCWYS